MARRSSNKQQPKNETENADDPRKRALKLQSAQRITDLREPTPGATGTEQIARRLAEARRLRDATPDQVPGG
ncbi:MAG: hypothetical protein ACR2QE_00060 [Acidimicrobiales bacterium]